MREFKDGEIVGLDNDSCILVFCSEPEQIYNCGETLKDFGINNLTKEELHRVCWDAAGLLKANLEL